MMGVHPCSVDGGYREELEAARQWLDQRPFVAVGEIGLDYHWDLTWKAEQQEAFRTQVQWAVERNLPSVIHSRKSTADCIRILEEFPRGVPRGVFHCFSDDLDTAKKVLDLGFHLGIGGVVTYKNAGLDAVVRELPLEALVLETDAPYLSPVPFRGKRNESGYIKYVAARIAEVKGCTLEEVDRVTTATARKIFGLP
jgi:TatD DNase family protein